MKKPKSHLKRLLDLEPYEQARILYSAKFVLRMPHKYTPEKVELAKKRYDVLSTLALLNPTVSTWPKWNADADI